MSAAVVTYPVTTIYIGNNISPDFNVSDTKGNYFNELVKHA